MNRSAPGGLVLNSAAHRRYSLFIYWFKTLKSKHTRQGKSCNIPLTSELHTMHILACNNGLTRGGACGHTLLQVRSCGVTVASIVTHPSITPHSTDTPGRPQLALAVRPDGPPRVSRHPTPRRGRLLARPVSTPRPGC